MSKDLKPKQRLGQAGSKRGKIVRWTVCRTAAGRRWLRVLAVSVERRARRSSGLEGTSRGFCRLRSETRGEISSVNSIIVSAPQVPDSRIVRIAESGSLGEAGDVVVEFDAAQQEQTCSKTTPTSARSTAKSCRPKPHTGSLTSRTASI